MSPKMIDIHLRRAGIEPAPRKPSPPDYSLHCDECRAKERKPPVFMHWQEGMSWRAQCLEQGACIACGTHCRGK